MITKELNYHTCPQCNITLCIILAGMYPVFREWEGGWCSSSTWWRHQMETFSALLALCAGISRVLYAQGNKSIYMKHRTPVYVCFLDASKAFDCVNHWELFDVMIERKCPAFIIRLRLRLRLRQVYSTQHDIIQMHDIRHTWQFLCIIQN